MKSFKKVLSVFLSAAMCFCLVPFASAGSVNGDITIDNPYADVNWDTWQPYKTQLHCHTNASDGFLTIKELVQYSYDLGYNAVAVTDHGTLNRGWNKQPDLVPLMRLVKYERTQLADIAPLTDTEYNSYLSGTAKMSDGSVRTNGMLDIPLGIELNMATPKCDCHLTGYWSTYGQGLAGVYGDYETPSAGVKKAGGISFLSHVGEYVYPEKDSENYVGQPVDDYYAEKFARLFIDNQGSSLGMGINSAEDDHTRCDRILYDQVLQKTIPNGVIPWAFTFSDSHTKETLDLAYTINMMPELTLDNTRKSMENGTFFGISHYSFGVELDGIAEMPEGYVSDLSKKTPEITKITVNEKENTICVEGINFDRIVWVSNGNVICRAENIKNGTYTIDLDNYDAANLYVRFYVTGDGGICYSQPFVIVRDGEAFTPVDVPVTNDTSTFLRKLVTVIDKIFFKGNLITDLFKEYALGNPG